MSTVRNSARSTWTTRVTHELHQPFIGLCLTGSTSQQPMTFGGAHAVLQQWVAGEWSSNGCADLALQSLDAPAHIPTGGISLYTYAENNGQCVHHHLDHSMRRA